MKFKFKIQQYQTEAVENTVEVFAGQPLVDNYTYLRDLGRRTQDPQARLDLEDESQGYRNHDVKLSAEQLLKNIRKIQSKSDIPLSDKLVEGMGACNLDVEMETGTGKTYVYIKTMFELNKRYGWTKFIVVVPSIAIREGVKKSFDMLEEHFMEYYGKKARYFIYNSSSLKDLDDFSSSSAIQVMIINTQAFAASLKEGGRSKESRIIYSKRDDFASRRPIEVIAANRPIIIMDEPQKMEGEVTQTALCKFCPLFILNYSATHKTKHNTVYALDALDAFNKKLVKKIEVKGFEVKNLKGASSYMYLDDIILSKTEPPKAKIEIEVRSQSGIHRKARIVRKGDKLVEASNGLGAYAGFDILDISSDTDTVTFLNGEVLHKGEVVGDTNEVAMQRVQIRETISSHFDKERELFAKGIKTLSLFFVDEVAKYKSYDEDGEVVPGVFWRIFEEEYQNVLNERISLFDDEYKKYLLRFSVSEIHNGYFSIDKKGHSIDGKLKKNDFSDDISAYDLILKNKERLLSFDEPTRFIFSHSALREGWDNPNVFQICTLRHANSTTTKHQEVGRGLRLCVDSSGNRMDYETLGERVHDVNLLTVIANESYSGFVAGLQENIEQALRERPTKADIAFFEGKTLLVNGESHVISKLEAGSITSYLWDNDYTDDKGVVTQKYKDDLAAGKLAPLPTKMADLTEHVHKLVQSIFDAKVALEGLVEDGHKPKITQNNLNENFAKKEFQELWNQINHKYAYTVSYDSEELVEKACNSINANLEVTQLRYTIVTGEQQSAAEFGNTSSTSKRVGNVLPSSVKYDLIGDIAKGATLTRRTVVKILKGLSPKKIAMFQYNPEEFIRGIVKLIKEQKATMIVEHIAYNLVDGHYESSIFTEEKQQETLDRVYAAKKHILDYVVFDSQGERNFAREMDEATAVCVYAKLPRSFHIPTPVGNYAPDWAIAFEKRAVKHIFFVAETKGSMSSMDLSQIEQAKIDCARQLFNNVSNASVRYEVVDSYENLLNKMQE